MNILISFCNTIETPGYPNLGLINLETKVFSVPDLPDHIAQTGMLGLALTKEFLLVGQQHTEGGPGGYVSPPALLIFDKHNFTLLQSHPLQLVRDIHSFLWLEERSCLLIVSSGTDEVIEVVLDGTDLISEKLFWRPADHALRADTIHLNSIFRHKGDIYVSGFGKREIENEWSSAHDGFIHNISRDEKILGGLEQPHSIDIIDGQMAVCESRSKRLRFVTGERTIELPGYVRGLCHTDDFLFAGTSASRKKSKSTGRAVTAFADQVAGCTLHQISWPELDIVHVWDLNNYGIEIYELLLIEDVSSWPTMPQTNYREAYRQSWVYKAQNALDEIMQVIPSGKKVLIADVDQLQIKPSILPGYTYLPFMERDGTSWGPPVDDVTGISELIRMKEDGAEYLVIPWTAFWWLEQYPAFYVYVKQHCVVVRAGLRVFIFDLKAEMP